ncbi:MAG: cupin domain-containing protein [Gammaproteobacteria bacterium]|nr:cupin domain-containing protein [Gammaproteobacteria bacterium]
MKKIDLAAVQIMLGSGYPAPYDEPCRQRKRLRLGDAAGLTQFGVNLLRLPPGVWSSQRHWHSAEDEFVYVLQGEVVLVSDAGEEVLRAGDCAGFKAGEPNGHQLQNRSGAEAVLLEIGSRNPDRDAVDYPGIDLTIRAGTRAFLHRDGTPYPPRPR